LLLAPTEVASPACDNLSMVVFWSVLRSRVLLPFEIIRVDNGQDIHIVDTPLLQHIRGLSSVDAENDRPPSADSRPSTPSGSRDAISTSSSRSSDRSQAQPTAPTSTSQRRGLVNALLSPPRALRRQGRRRTTISMESTDDDSAERKLLPRPPSADSSQARDHRLQMFHNLNSSSSPHLPAMAQPRRISSPQLPQRRSLTDVHHPVLQHANSDSAALAPPSPASVMSATARSTSSPTHTSAILSPSSTLSPSNSSSLNLSPYKPVISANVSMMLSIPTVVLRTATSVQHNLHGNAILLVTDKLVRLQRKTSFHDWYLSGIERYFARDKEHLELAVHSSKHNGLLQLILRVDDAYALQRMIAERLTDESDA